MVRHRWISQDGKACLLASWFLSRDVAVHSGVVGASAPAPRCFKFRRKTRPGDPGGTTTADATVWQNPCSAAGGLYVVSERPRCLHCVLVLSVSPLTCDARGRGAGRAHPAPPGGTLHTGCKGVVDSTGSAQGR